MDLENGGLNANIIDDCSASKKNAEQSIDRKLEHDLRLNSEHLPEGLQSLERTVEVVVSDKKLNIEINNNFLNYGAYKIGASNEIAEKKEFSDRPELLPSLVLAYIGDAVYELTVREHLIRQGLCRMHKLHRSAVHYVRASAQADVLHELESLLQSIEPDVVRRGRNAKPGHCPKGVTQEEYSYSTALESLIGYLYLKGDFTRLSEILDKIFSIVDKPAYK